MAEETEQQQAPELDDRVQRVLNVIAMHIGSFHTRERTGTLTFNIQFKDGQLPQNGFNQNINEDVL